MYNCTLSKAFIAFVVLISTMALHLLEIQAAPLETPSVVWRTPVVFNTKLMSISPNGRTMLCAGGLGDPTSIVQIVDVESGVTLARYEVNLNAFHQAKDRIKNMHFLNDSSIMVLTSHSFYVVDSRNGTVIEDVGYPSTPAGYDVAVPMYNTDDWIVGCYGGLFIYHYKTRNLDTIYYHPNDNSYGHPGQTGWIGLSEDERTVYSGGSRDYNFPRSGRLCAWDIASGERKYQIDEPDSIYLQLSSPFSHGNFMGALGISKAAVFDLRTGSLVAQYRNIDGNMQGIGTSLDGSILGIQNSGNVDFFTTKDSHLFAQIPASAYNIHFVNKGAPDVIIGQIDTFVVRARLDLTTSVEDDASNQKMQFSIVPNPSTNRAVLQLTLALPSSVDIRLTATDGRVVLQRTLGFLRAGTYSEELQAPSGYYMCTVTAGEEKQSLPFLIR